MNLSRHETEILQQLSKGAASAPETNSMDALAAHWRAQQLPGDELPKALDSLQSKCFVEIAANGNILITDMGNAALASV
jgi:hypothetical protein